MAPTLMLSTPSPTQPSRILNPPIQTTSIVRTGRGDGCRAGSTIRPDVSEVIVELGSEARPGWCDALGQVCPGGLHVLTELHLLSGLRSELIVAWVGAEAVGSDACQRCV